MSNSPDSRPDLTADERRSKSSPASAVFASPHISEIKKSGQNAAKQIADRTKARDADGGLTEHHVASTSHSPETLELVCAEAVEVERLRQRRPRAAGQGRVRRREGRP